MPVVEYGQIMTANTISESAKAKARDFIEDVTNRKLSVAKMFKYDCGVK